MSIIAQMSQRIQELERKNRGLKIRLDMYDRDATDLIEEHGCDPEDKIDREVLKRMLNCLIGKNRKLENKNNELIAKCGHQVISINELRKELEVLE